MKHSYRILKVVLSDLQGAAFKKTFFREIKVPANFVWYFFLLSNLPTNNVVPTLFFSGLTYPLFFSSDRFLPTCATWSVSRQRRCIMSQRFARWQTTWGHFDQLEKTVICHYGIRSDPRRPSQPPFLYARRAFGVHQKAGLYCWSRWWTTKSML